MSSLHEKIVAASAIKNAALANYFSIALDAQLMKHVQDEANAVSEAEAISAAQALGLLVKSLDRRNGLLWWRFGIAVELEHGLADIVTNVTNNDILITAKIALKHICEMPDYYQRLAVMERDGREFWTHVRKPRVLGKKSKK